MTLDDLIAQLRFARFYSKRLLEHTPVEDWFCIPPAGVSHVAWQVGHLAMAGYRMALERVRGRQPDDAELIGNDFLTLFGRESVPLADANAYPSAEQIRRVFDRVHERILIELPQQDEAILDQPPPGRPHSLAKTRRECIAWCAQHELVHAGQIGLIRRQLGHPPVW
jgi:hypothetical protein